MSDSPRISEGAVPGDAPSEVTPGGGPSGGPAGSLPPGVEPISPTARPLAARTPAAAADPIGVGPALSTSGPSTQPQNTEPYNAEPYNAEPYNAEPYNAEPYNAEPYNAEPFGQGRAPSIRPYAAEHPYTPAQPAPPPAQPAPQYAQPAPPPAQPTPPYAQPAPQYAQPYGEPMPGYGGAPPFNTAPPSVAQPYATGVPPIKRKRRWPLITLAALVALTALAGGAVAGLQVQAEVMRPPTPAELERAAAKEIVERWQAWPTGKIFPDQVKYLAEQGAEEQAQRVGIAPTTDCAHAADTELVSKIRQYGCRGALRATYLDQLQGLAITVGVVAFPDERSAAQAKSAFPADGKPAPGLKALGFPQTLTARFNDAARQASSVRQAGPYLVLTSAGHVDGRPAAAVKKQRPTLFALAPEIGERIAKPLAEPILPDCAMKEWAC